MRTLYRLFILLCFSSVPMFSWAAQTAQIIAVQAEAWVVRGEASYPAKVNMALQAQDQIRTGANSRVIVKLPDDSVVKLGQYAIVNLSSILPAEENQGVFSAALEVLQGAFRFTSEKPAQRDVNIKIGKSITAGIRGTDLWGSAWLNAQTVLCLLEGRVAVSSGQVNAVMDQPLDYFIVPEGQTPLPVGQLPEEKLQEWIKWTELMPEK